jgi:hypothetical protein
LAHKLREIANGPTLNGTHTEPDSILYHYTNMEGLQGIITSGVLWATLLPCLDDDFETQHLIDSCFDYLDERISRESDAQKKKFLHELRDTMRSGEDIVHCLDKQAATCLSTKINLSVQWETYADEGNGYALGFDSNELAHVLGARCLDPNSSTVPNWIPQKMTYSSVEQLKLMDDIIDSFFEFAHVLTPTTAHTGRALIASVAYALSRAAASCKHPQFASENELRLSIANHLEISIPGNPLPINFRKKNGRQIGYLDVDLRGPHTGLMPLKEIVIGPNMDLDKAQQVIESILGETECIAPESVLTRKIGREELRDEPSCGS